MSVRVNNRDYSRSKYAAAEKPVKKFCGVCQKAGLSEKEYTSHFTKSVPGPQGIVICPTILNNECSFCYQFGHFKSACPALAQREKQQKRSDMQEKRVQFKESVQKKASAISHGAFSALADSDSDSDEEHVTAKRTFSQANRVEKVVIKEEWPALSSKPVAKSTTDDKPSFATVTSSVAPIKKEDTSRPPICGFSVITKAGIVHAPTKEVEQNVYKPSARRSWVDMMSDSEDEEEDDYFDNSAW